MSPARQFPTCSLRESAAGITAFAAHTLAPASGRALEGKAALADAPGVAGYLAAVAHAPHCAHKRGDLQGDVMTAVAAQRHASGGHGLHGRHARRHVKYKETARGGLAVNVIEC
jgi:hypothetical protein